MNKDVIYIDVEDDITAIIGKVKDSKEKIVALVPPKRIGVLQSAVNLRLLQRAAENGDKRMVVISNNQALMALAANAKIPVAKNLQSKPEVPEIAALELDDGDDVIDGSDLPVGEHAKMGTSSSDATPTDVAAAELIESTAPSPSDTGPAKPAVKKSSKVPNFNRFRKRLILIIIAAILLIGFVIWAIFIAPRATVVITASTSDSNVAQTAKLADDATTDFEANTIKSTTQTQDKKADIDFTATGKDTIGDKASGSMKLTRTNPSATPLTVPAGTHFTSGSYTFVSTESATLSSSLTGGGVDPGSATVNVKATKIGSEYNLSARSYQTDQDGIQAKGSDMSGGNSKEVTIVTAGDVQKARQDLVDSTDDSIKDSLHAKFDKDITIIDDSFKTSFDDVTTSPGVGERAKGTPKLTGTITYSLTGIENSELDGYLNKALETNLEDKVTQRVYDSGRDKIEFSDFSGKAGDAKVTLKTTGQLGPKIDENEIKDKVKGKKSGEIQADLEAINGVETAETKFFPFWVNSVPDNIDKISIEFKLKDEQ